MLRDEYLPGVPCWIDLAQTDVERMLQFYGDLFGWTYDVRTPPEAPSTYAYALIDGATVGGVGGPPEAGTAPGWTMGVRVERAEATADAVVAAGGKVVVGPADVGPAGRWALCTDPQGAQFGLWEPKENRGAQLVNAHGAWNFNELRTPDGEAAARFYADVFGWESAPFDFGIPEPTWLFRKPGYGAFLAERDPDVAAWIESGQGPEGFPDAVAWMTPFDPAGRADTDASWATTFGVDDVDAAYARALELGAEAVEPLRDTAYTRDGVVRDPQGTEVMLSQYKPPAQD